jgi:chromosome segregation ATPase
MPVLCRYFPCICTDIIPAHADGRFHELEAQTAKARLEIEGLGRVKDEAVSQRDKLSKQLTELTAELTEANAKYNKAAAEASKARTEAEDAVRANEKLSWAATRRGEEASRAQTEASEMSKRLAAEVQSRISAVAELDEERHKSIKLQADLARFQSEAQHYKLTNENAEKELRETLDKLARCKSESTSKTMSLQSQCEYCIC